MDGRRLRQLRRSAGFTQLQLAMRAGLALVTITNIEQGTRTNPTLTTLEALARALGVSVDELIAEPEPEEVAS